MIIVFDGVCNLCNGWVRFVLEHDRAGRFRFATTQSEFGREVLSRIGEEPDNPGTIVLVNGTEIYTRSDAVLRILGTLGGIWTLPAALRVLPAALRDGAYDFIAHRRYVWFGRTAQCLTPAPHWRDRFLT